MNTAQPQFLGLVPLKSNPYIVGITGKNASGKGEVANILRSLGYAYYSLSDVLREEATKQNLDPSRENLIQLGKDLRQGGGPGVLAAMTAKKFTEENYVIDSIRNPVEVEILRKAGNFFLIGVDAPIETRFMRAQKRGRNENALTLRDFKDMEDLEHSNRNPAQQLDKCFEMVDEHIQNEADLGVLKDRVLNVLKQRNFPKN